ncbi:potassium channel subfamily K member 17-like [Scleropages formosus]|uniref:potassium channel subfamily K member 17-like n=1 Tax=Scleropages formosus TaxID=113540 RepID=UPI0010FAC4E9|nr:potassium channel subfamily K member 17-like [Scleropages formosus]
MRLPSILLLGLLYVAYVLFGGFVFWKLEGSQMLDTMTSVEKVRISLMRRLPCVDQEAIDNLSQVIQQASKSGLSLKGNRTMDGFWKFTSSSVFAATVVTTIGYGNMSPSSTYGQIFCVFFALFGIPLNVVVLNKVGKYMLLIEMNFCEFITTKTGHKRCIKVVIHSLSCMIGTVIFFVVPMLVFSMEEGWSYSQSIYYCFITLSTIGFGDYVADSNPDRTYPEWYGCLTAVWIFFGLAWLALLINHSIDILEGINAHFKQEKSQPEDGGRNSNDRCSEEAEGHSAKHDLAEDLVPEQ